MPKEHARGEGDNQTGGDPTQSCCRNRGAFYCAGTYCAGTKRPARLSNETTDATRPTRTATRSRPNHTQHSTIILSGHHQYHTIFRQHGNFPSLDHQRSHRRRKHHRPPTKPQSTPPPPSPPPPSLKNRHEVNALGYHLLQAAIVQASMKPQRKLQLHMHSEEGAQHITSTAPIEGTRREYRPTNARHYVVS